MAANKQYRFKTIMVTDSDRADFSALRDGFDGKVSDKELFAAMFDVVDLDEVRKNVNAMLASRAERREREKIQKLEAKLKEKLEKLEASKTPVTEETAEEAAA